MLSPGRDAPAGASASAEMVMAFDFGARRIGVAIGERFLGTARALTTIEGERMQARFAAIARLIDEWRPSRLIVGRPAHVDRAGDHAFAHRCERFARQLAGRFGLPVELVDERYTSLMAESRLSGDKRKHKARLDAEAAAILLEAWFHEHAHPRPRG
ncbi:MAG: Holliday junction resolvase RuvX [Rhodocyclaceae bacterium]|nr:Holliday junction resolvase RuvX [Rhodocyclaceae bacterium]